MTKRVAANPHSFRRSLKICVKAILYSKIVYKKINRTLNKFKAKIIHKRHESLINEYKTQGQKPLKVVFIVLNKSVWKVDPIFKKMLADDAFEPLILVAPYIVYGEAKMHSDMDNTYVFFQEKNYPVVRAYENNAWLDVRETIKPDIIFFSNPHDLTKPEYYSELFANHISYYVPYYHQISRWQDYQPQYNQLFHNAMWRIFSPHDTALKLHQQYSDNKGSNVLVTGYPAMEPFLDKHHVPTAAWKAQQKKKLKIIWAPHHTIDMPDLPYSNFLKYAEYFEQMAKQTENEIQWAFKPHPLLKTKLSAHHAWGKTKTENYWSFWAKAPNCQLEEGEYVDLFLQSDAMIHDSGSFLAEYLYINKPVLYLSSTTKIEEYFNPFGSAAYAVCAHAFHENDIQEFITNLTLQCDPMLEARQAFMDKNIQPYFADKSPSDKVIESIKKDFERIG